MGTPVNLRLSSQKCPICQNYLFVQRAPSGLTPLIRNQATATRRLRTSNTSVRSHQKSSISRVSRQTAGGSAGACTQPGVNVTNKHIVCLYNKLYKTNHMRFEQLKTALRPSARPGPALDRVRESGLSRHSVDLEGTKGVPRKGGRRQHLV